MRIKQNHWKLLQVFIIFNVLRADFSKYSFKYTTAYRFPFNKSAAGVGKPARIAGWNPGPISQQALISLMSTVHLLSFQSWAGSVVLSETGNSLPLFYLSAFAEWCVTHEPTVLQQLIQCLTAAHTSTMWQSIGSLNPSACTLHQCHDNDTSTLLREITRWHNLYNWLWD